MAIPRQLEPEFVDTAKESQDYRDMDHESVNARFVTDLLAGGQIGDRVIDMGCGPCLIPVELCKRDPNVQVMGLDAAMEMLELARFEIEFAGLVERVFLEHVDVKSMPYFDEDIVDTVISNTLLHHLPQPELALQAAIRIVKPGGRLFIRDLVRPDSEDAVQQLVALHAGEAETAGKQLLTQSLRAALTLAEIRSLASALGISDDHVQMTSDRHWTLDWRHPETSDTQP